MRRRRIPVGNSLPRAPRLPEPSERPATCRQLPPALQPVARQLPAAHLPLSPAARRLLVFQLAPSLRSSGTCPAARERTKPTPFPPVANPTACSPLLCGPPPAAHGWAKNASYDPPAACCPSPSTRHSPPSGARLSLSLSLLLTATAASLPRPATHRLLD